MANNDIPNFTPPSPTFTPPSAPRHNGPCCHYHQNEPAVDKCARCGKYICQDCAETYTVNSDEYKGKALCYDCCKEIVADNVHELKKNKRSILVHFIATIIGMIALPVYGAFTGLYAEASGMGETIGLIVAAALLGGSLWTYFKYIVLSCKAAYQKSRSIWAPLIGFILYAFIGMFVAIFRTVKKIITYSKYLKRTSNFIESDTAALQQMADYMEYTLVRSRNVGVDLATLMNEDSELSNNSYAQAVVANGEAAAEASLRNAAVTFNEHGEIIRSFAA